MAIEITGNYSSYSYIAQSITGSGTASSTKKNETGSGAASSTKKNETGSGALSSTKKNETGSGALSSIKKNETGSSAASNIKKKETESASETSVSSNSKSTTEYVSELAKLVPSVELKVGNSFSTAKSGITLTINPQLLKKMQNDPAQEKETKELLKGIESVTNLIDSINKATGWTVVYRHSYIDENGKYCAISCVRNDFMLNMSDKLREERKKNSEELVEKTKEKAVEKEEKLEEILEETLEEKEEAKEEEIKTKEEEETEEKAEEIIEGKIEERTEKEEEKKTEDKIEEKKEEEIIKEKIKERAAQKAEEKSAYIRTKQLINEKMATSKDGTIYLNDSDIWTIIEAIQEDNAEKAAVKEQSIVGANLDLKI